jgi:hypothetical protein
MLPAKLANGRIVVFVSLAMNYIMKLKGKFCVYSITRDPAAIELVYL